VLRYDLDVILLESLERSFLIVVDSSLFESKETRRLVSFKLDEENRREKSGDEPYG